MQNIIQVSAYIPPLYRYLESQYVDLFFTMGILRISSFEHFAAHPNETRLDTQEGRANLIGNCQNSDMRVEIGFGIGNCFVLCTSLIKSKELSNKFKTDACFKIKDFYNFYSCIGNALTKNNYIIGSGMHGPCRYEDKRELISKIEQNDIDKINIDDKNHTMNFNAIFELGGKIAGQDLYFLKLDDYANEHEYRMIWVPRFNEPKIPKYIDLCIPDAVQFCEKVKI